MREIPKKIEHEHGLYETFEIDRSNTPDLLSNNQIFLVDFLLTSMISSKKFTRITFALSFKTIK